MVAEDIMFSSAQPNIGLSKNKTTSLVKECMVEAVTRFKSYLKLGHIQKKKLSEDDLTQEFTKQIQILIREKEYPFNVQNQYRDVYNISKGFSDFFFFPNEQNAELSSIYSVESKRLPTPEKSREKEYVIGDKNNGGIERYKSEKHGKGLSECGLLGFIENNSFRHWETVINGWINDLAQAPNTIWKTDEVLSSAKECNDFCVLHSVAYRQNNVIYLTHLWISII